MSGPDSIKIKLCVSRRPCIAELNNGGKELPADKLERYQGVLKRNLENLLSLVQLVASASALKVRNVNKDSLTHTLRKIHTDSSMGVQRVYNAQQKQEGGSYSEECMAAICVGLNKENNRLIKQIQEQKPKLNLFVDNNTVDETISSLEGISN